MGKKNTQTERFIFKEEHYSLEKYLYDKIWTFLTVRNTCNGAMYLHINLSNCIHLLQGRTLDVNKTRCLHSTANLLQHTNHPDTPVSSETFSWIFVKKVLFQDIMK